MRFALFCHSLRSDWNNGHAHFHRGLVRSLVAMGHEVASYEEAEGWSVANLVQTQGMRPLVEFRRRVPEVAVRLYTGHPAGRLERRLRQELSGVDVVIVAEWPAAENPALLNLLVRLRQECGYLLLFHDSHYRILTQRARMARLGVERCDAVLAYSPSIADAYRSGLGLDPESVYVVHEAADTDLFRPLPLDPTRPWDDALFVGNWGGHDRAAELRAYLLRPARRHRQERRFALYGVRYPPEVLPEIEGHYGVHYRGWLPNFRVPGAFAQTRVVLHVPRRQYVRALYGTPTIRVFEALACGVPLVSTPWPDTDGLFRAGEDYLVVGSPAQQEETLQWLWRDESARLRLGRSGRERILAGHTCRHRAEQILGIVARLRGHAPRERQLPEEAAVAAGG